MPRPKRIWIPDRFYHIGCRGNRREPLFLSPSDYHAFFRILTQIHLRYPIEIASYCIMTNHYHLQLRSSEVHISKIMALLNKRYSSYFNTNYRLTGHTFEKRFFDKAIHDKDGMLEVSRYIHLNPLEAKMVKKPESFPWSSYYFYKNPMFQPPIFMNTNSLLEYYPGDAEAQKKSYCKYVESKNTLKTNILHDPWNIE
jgi:putative transposase